MTKTKKRDILAYEIMTKPVEAVRINDSLQDVAHLFTENHIGAAAVLDGQGKPVGVITKTDIVRYENAKDGNKTVDKQYPPHLNGEQRPSNYHTIGDEESVQNWMTPVIFTIKPETPLKEIARRMVSYGIHHIFVHGKKGEPIIGIVSSFDVLRYVATKTGPRTSGLESRRR